MTVTSNTTRNDYVAGTNQNVYNYTFQLNEGSDVTVYLGGVVQTRNVHYTVQDLGVGTGGTITFTLVDSGGNPIYPTPGTIISILMTMELDRDTDYQPNGVFLASEVNNDYDRLWLATNQQQTAINRSLRLQDDDVAGASPSMELPLKDDRKGKILSFDSVTGEPITAIPAEYEIPTLAETLAEGNTTGGNDIVHDTNDKAVFGTGAVGSALEIYTDGTGSGRIENVGLGSMVLKAPNYVFRNDSDDSILTLFQNRSASFKDNTGNTRMSVGAGKVVINDEARVYGSLRFDELATNTALDPGGSGGPIIDEIFDEDDMASDSATGLATQQSIKAYVDSQVGTVDTLSEVLANGNTTGGNDIAFGDNDKATFGANTDLEIYSDASSSFIKELGPGGLVVQGANVNIKNSSGQAIAAFTNARSSIFYDSGGIDRLTVRSGGITVDGQARINGEVFFDSIQRNGINAVVIDDILDEDNMASDSATALATQQSIKAYVDSQSSSDSLSTILGNGNTTGGNDIVYTTNDKAVFGTGAVGSVLELYSDGTGSGRIENVGAGSMILKAPDFVFRNDSDQGILTLTQSRSASFTDSTGNTRMSVGNGRVTIHDEARVEGTVTFDDLGRNGAGAVLVNDILDEDNMASDSATALATQQSIKAYVDASAGTTYTAGTGITLTGTEFSIGQPVATTDNVEFVDILATGRITVGNVTNNSTRSAVIGDNCTNAGYGALVVGMEHQNDGDLNLISGYDNDCGSGATLNAISGANHTVTGDNNLVAGNNNSALSSFGLVSGYNTSIQASADNSFVGGYECEARGTNSFAFGSTWANVKVRAFGINSFALGGGNTTHTNANNSMAIGALCEVGQTSPPAGRSANQGFAMGYECKVYENNGMAGGNDSLCFSDGGMAFGYGATASDAEANFAFGKGVTTPVTSNVGNDVGQVAVGQWNAWQANTPHLFAVGCGSSDTNRKTALCVRKSSTTALVGVNLLNPLYNLHVNGNAAKSSGIYWINTSDERTKENIREYDKGLDEICQLNTKLYDFNGKGQTEVRQDNVGVIAQDVLPIFPEAIGTYEAKLNEEDAEDTELYNIDMQPITFAMINAIKDLKAENDALKARLDAAGL